MSICETRCDVKIILCEGVASLVVCEAPKLHPTRLATGQGRRYVLHFVRPWGGTVVECAPTNLKVLGSSPGGFNHPVWL